MFQKITIIGNLGKDPEMRYTPSGTAVTNFSVATTTKVSKADDRPCPEGWKESYNKKAWELTTWWRVTCWRKMGEACNEYLRKGSQVYVEGEINGQAVDGTQYPRIWTGNDGVPKASFEITARLVKFIGRRAGNGEQGGRSVWEEEEPPTEYAPQHDNIPF